MRPFRWDDDRVRMILLAGMMRHGCGADAIVRMPGFVLKESFQDESEWAGYAEMVDECGAWDDAGGHESNRLCEAMQYLVGCRFHGLAVATPNCVDVIHDDLTTRVLSWELGMLVVATDFRQVDLVDDRIVVAVLPGRHDDLVSDGELHPLPYTSDIDVANIVCVGGTARVVIDREPTTEYMLARANRQRASGPYSWRSPALMGGRVSINRYRFNVG